MILAVRSHGSTLLPETAHLDPGEREAIALASEVAEPLLLVDDGEARRAAAHYGIPVIGTLGVLRKAAR